jgi:deoxyhypusine synthase
MEERNRTKFGTGYNHGFIPLESIDLSKIKDADDLVKAMSKTAFGGRRLGEAADVFYNMITDPDCFVVMTLSGAMTVAKMGLVITDMIDQKMVQAVVSTGALITHGLVENTGMTHFKYDFSKSDLELEKLGYDRIYDTLELEKNLDDIEVILNKVFDKFDSNEIMCSRVITERIGKYLDEETPGRGILKSTYKFKVPVYIPAFTDSELALDFGIFNRKRKIDGKEPLQFNPFLDLDHFAELILKQKTLGIFTIGGGVPRNWAQQVGPYLDFIRFRLRDESDQDKYFVGREDPYNKAYKYAVRICPEPVEWGGLSGCTYSEGVTWGKFWDKHKEGGQFAEVLSDATYVWPLLIKAVQERLKKNKVKINKNFTNENI